MDLFRQEVEMPAGLAHSHHATCEPVQITNTDFVQEQSARGGSPTTHMCYRTCVCEEEEVWPSLINVSCAFADVRAGKHILVF